MVRLIPPSTTLYWPNSLTVWSSPLPTQSYQPNFLIWQGLKLSTANEFYQYTGSYYQTVVAWRLLTPGNYKLAFKLYGGTANTVVVRVLVNGQIKASFLSPSPGVVRAVEVLLSNIPGNSVLELQAGYNTSLCDVMLYGGLNAIAFLIQIKEGSPTEITSSQQQTHTSQLDVGAEPPPPARLVSNVPVKVKGKYVIQ